MKSCPCGNIFKHRTSVQGDSSNVHVWGSACRSDRILSHWFLTFFNCCWLYYYFPQFYRGWRVLGSNASWTLVTSSWIKEPLPSNSGDSGSAALKASLDINYLGSSVIKLTSTTLACSCGITWSLWEEYTPAIWICFFFFGPEKFQRDKTQVKRFWLVKITGQHVF